MSENGGGRMSFITRWLLNAVAIGITAYLIPGMDVNGFWALLWAGLILGLLNAIIKPILFVLTLPITVLTLGIFALVLNGIMLYITAWIVGGFSIASFWTAVLGSIVISIISSILSKIL